MKREELTVTGMTCAFCSARIERVVGRLEGVRNVSVNLAIERADVLYDPAAVRLSAIKQAITAAGYTPREVDAGETVDRDAQRKEREIRSLRTRFLVAASAAVLYSLYSTWKILSGDFAAVEDLYFETAAVIIALILLGRSSATMRLSITTGSPWATGTWWSGPKTSRKTTRTWSSS